MLNSFQHLKKAFTLAEVLITLAIIGVVAALTIPTVVRNYQEKQLITQLKKAYSDLSKAYQMATIEDGEITTWNLTKDITSRALMAEKFSKYLKVSKKCPEGTEPHCFANTDYKGFEGSATNWVARANKKMNFPTIKLADGTSMLFEVISGCTPTTLTGSKFYDNHCGNVFVDINGEKAPNALGKDVFAFNVTKYGIYPNGAPDAENGESEWAKFSKSCGRTQDRGHACTAWVLRNENMDYLKCDDLSWDGKHKCD